MRIVGFALRFFHDLTFRAIAARVIRRFNNKNGLGWTIFRTSVKEFLWLWQVFLEKCAVTAALLVNRK